MVLDQKTLWVVLTVTGLASTGGFAGLSRFAPRVQGLPFWAIASLCSALAFGSALIPFADWRLGSLF